MRRRRTHDLASRQMPVALQPTAAVICESAWRLDELAAPAHPNHSVARATLLKFLKPNRICARSVTHPGEMLHVQQAFAVPAATLRRAAKAGITGPTRSV